MKWTIEMTEEELARKSEIERVLEKRTTQAEAAIKLGLSQRQLRRILQRYRKEGVSGLVSKKRGVPSNRKTNESVMDEVRKFICDPLMSDFGPSLMAEKLEKTKGIRLSKETLRKIMIGEGIWKAKSKKKSEPHYERPRRMHRGELVQIDGSVHA